MENFKGKIVLFFLLAVISSCSINKAGSYRRIGGKKVWIPKKVRVLDRRYERCAF
jgi:hypothetical protein